MFDPQLVESMDQEEPMDTEGQLYIFCKYFLLSLVSLLILLILKSYVYM